jgi:hypothetical protein
MAGTVGTGHGEAPHLPQRFGWLFNNGLQHHPPQAWQFALVLNYVLFSAKQNNKYHKHIKHKHSQQTKRTTKTANKHTSTTQDAKHKHGNNTQMLKAIVHNMCLKSAWQFP